VRLPQLAGRGCSTIRGWLPDPRIGELSQLDRSRGEHGCDSGDPEAVEELAAQDVADDQVTCASASRLNRDGQLRNRGSDGHEGDSDRHLRRGADQ